MRKHYLIPLTLPTDNHAQNLWRDSLQAIREERVKAGENLPRYDEDWRDLPGADAQNPIDLSVEPTPSRPADRTPDPSDSPKTPQIQQNQHFRRADRHVPPTAEQLEFLRQWGKTQNWRPPNFAAAQGVIDEIKRGKRYRRLSSTGNAAAVTSAKPGEYQQQNKSGPEISHALAGAVKQHSVDTHSTRPDPAELAPSKPNPGAVYPHDPVLTPMDGSQRAMMHTTGPLQAPGKLP